jgi:hypothetical protein
MGFAIIGWLDIQLHTLYFFVYLILFQRELSNPSDKSCSHNHCSVIDFCTMLEDQLLWRNSDLCTQEMWRLCMLRLFELLWELGDVVHLVVGMLFSMCSMTCYVFVTWVLNSMHTSYISYCVMIPVQTSHSGPSSAHQIHEAKFYGGNKPPIMKALQKRITMKLESAPHGITAILQSGIPQLVNWYVPCCYVWISSSLTRTRSSTLPLRIIILTKMRFGHTEILLLHWPHDLVCLNWIYNHRWSSWHRCSCRHWPNSCRLVQSYSLICCFHNL